MNAYARVSDDAPRDMLVRWSKESKLFALIDSQFQLPARATRKVLQFKDTDPVFYELIAWDKVRYEAPVLVQVDLETLHWLLDALSTERWGVFFASDFDLTSLTHHFQKFVIARGPDQNPYFLRFHDASVLEVLLRTWSPAEREIFSMPVKAIGYPELDGLDVRIWANKDASSDTRIIPRAEECLLDISAGQLQECARAIDRDLIKIIYWHLRNHHSKAVQYLDRAKLEPRIAEGLLRAKSYALTAITDLAGFVALMFELAPNFDEHPAFRAALSRPALAEESKIRRLSKVITDQEWGEALRNFDRTFWSKR